MKNYEIVKVEISQLFPSDVIATSVTFETDEGIWGFGSRPNDVSEIYVDYLETPRGSYEGAN